MELDPRRSPIGEAVGLAAGVRRAGAADTPATAAALARAFQTDPVISWCFRDETRRPRQLETGFELWLRRIYLAKQETYVTEPVVGAALWLPPGMWKLSVRTQLRLLPTMMRAFGRELPRFARFLAAMERTHPHEDHMYLGVLGVDPDWQGRGVGTALMRPVLERCDSQGRPAYLEASSPRNKALYERNGFEVVEELHVEDAPPLWRMWREPRS